MVDLLVGSRDCGKYEDDRMDFLVIVYGLWIDARECWDKSRER